jgi:hypothetical protein
MDFAADDDELRKVLAAANGKPAFIALSPESAGATPSRSAAAGLGFKIATHSAALLSPAV